jgi:hypothetical protein
MSAAEGLDAAAEALNVARPLKEAIEERKRASTGFKPMALNDTEVFVAKVNDASVKLAAEIPSHEQMIKSSPDIQQRLVVAHRRMGAVVYYGASAAVGGTLFGRFMNDNASKKTLYATLDSKYIGLGSEFANELPRRGERILATLTGTFQIRAALRSVTSDPADGATSATEQAKADAKAIAKQIRDELSRQGQPLTPRQAGGSV